MLPESKYELHCDHHAIIIRNESLEDKYPGGIDAFRNRYRPDFNDHFSILCVASRLIWYTVRKLEIVGLVQVEDFITFDTVKCKTWQMVHSDDIERPFWFETGVEWLNYKYADGKVFVWSNG